MILIDMRRRIVSDHGGAEIHDFAARLKLSRQRDFATDPNQGYSYYRLPLNRRCSEAVALGARIVTIPILDRDAHRKAPMTGMEKFRPARRHRRRYGPKVVIKSTEHRAESVGPRSKEEGMRN